ncbi:hypothetical protein AAEO56_08815 [Flavobacterium sp. DGU11]|uniref:Uncharacterized protein n=1 Tax=Flavobacterium arundinis TaxID=3139143 RepID=A0ABU9HXB1_9FLAO
MDIEKLRQEIIKKIEETDDMELLLKIRAIIDDYWMVNEPSVQYGIESDEDIVAYTVDGKPLTKAEYIADIDSIINSNEKGIPHHEVKAQMDKWIQDRLSGTL